MNELISIIVPVYNVELYIRKCVDSLCKQDYDNIEIILIDDGSPDDSGKIIDELKSFDSRIICFHTENNGVSSARNLGLQMAKGEWIMFVDGDDWVENDYVSYFYSIACKYELCIVMNKNNYYVWSEKSADKQYTITSEKAMEWIYSDQIFVAVWNKMYNRRFLQDNKIIFRQDIWYGEGMLFNIECLQYVNVIAVGEKSVYHQTFNPESAMRKFSLKNNLCGIRSLYIQKSLWKKHTSQIEGQWEFHRYRFNRTIIDGLVRSNMIEENMEIYKECKRNIRIGAKLPMKYALTLKEKIFWICYIISPRIMAERSARRFRKTVNMNK